MATSLARMLATWDAPAPREASVNPFAADVVPLAEAVVPLFTRSETEPVPTICVKTPFVDTGRLAFVAIVPGSEYAASEGVVPL